MTRIIQARAGANLRVEDRGLEPLTSCMPCKRLLRFFGVVCIFFVPTLPLTLPIWYRIWYRVVVVYAVLWRGSGNMPASYDLTWDGTNKRWRIMHKGKRYVVSCRQLGTVPTKESSYVAANEWWRLKLSEIESDPRRMDRIRQDLGSQAGWMERIGETTKKMVEAQRELLAKPESEWTIDDVASLIVPMPELGESKSTPIDFTVGYHVGRYLDLERARINAGQLSLIEFDLARRCLDYFAQWIKPTTSIKVIDPDRWEDFWTHLMGLHCSTEYKKKRFRYAKNFVTWLASKALIPVPPNLMSRKYKFGSTVMKVSTFTVDEVKALIDASTGQLTLHLLLMVNCGFTQQDVADLVDDEVNWKAGTITRKRSKTRNHDDVPTVTYLLWKRTFELLKKYRQQEGGLVLRTKSGQPWITKRQTNGVFNRSDNTKSVYRHLQEFTSTDKPIKLLRKTSSSLLDTHKDYGRYAGYFLAHSPTTVRDKSYVKPSQDQFDLAVAWLGSQYGKQVSG
jgi:integrase